MEKDINKIEEITNKRKSANINYFYKIIKDNDYIFDDNQIQHNALNTNSLNKNELINKNKLIFLRKSSSDNSLDEYNAKSCQKINSNRKKNKKKRLRSSNVKK